MPSVCSKPAPSSFGQVTAVGAQFPPVRIIFSSCEALQECAVDLCHFALGVEACEDEECDVLPVETFQENACALRDWIGESSGTMRMDLAAACITSWLASHIGAPVGTDVSVSTSPPTIATAGLAHAGGREAQGPDDQAGFPLGSFKLKPAEVPEELLGMKEAEDALEAKLPDGYGVSDMSTDVTAASVSDGNPEPSTVELSEMLVEMRSELQRLRCMRSIETSDLAAAGAVAKTDTVPVPTELLQMIVDMWQELQRLISKVSKDSKDSKELLSPTSLKTSTTCKSVVTVMSSTTTEQEVVTDEATNSEEALPSPDFPWPTRGSDFGASLTTDANWTPPSGPPEPENFVQRMHTCDSALDTHRADMSSIPMLPAQAFRTGHDTQTWGPSKLENQSWGPPKHVVRMKSVPSHVPSAYQPSVLDPVAVSTQPEQELSPTHALRRTIPGVQPARCETPSSKTTRSMMSGASSSMQSPATGLRSPCSPRPVSPNRVVAMVPSVQAAQSPSLALRSPRPSPRPSSPPGRMVPCPVVHSPVAGMRSSRPELAMVQAAAPLRSPTPSINSSMRSPTPSMQWVRVPSTYGPPAGGAKMQPLLVHRQVAITETYMKLDGDAARSLPPS
mmetsp:Transcript_156741/g.300626  ORF Transcript_156741/g.300626 Transcript_156741/m.300626 type:complete len:619 (-) Transcript_156741:86-1942(-)